MACGRLAKDVHYLQKHVAALTNGQAVITDVDDNLEFLKLDILPNDGYYKGARIQFKLIFLESYPEEVPQVLCLDRVYHPNIDTEVLTNTDLDIIEGSNICVSLLDEWDSEMDLDHVVMAILFLMYHPNPSDALSVYFDAEAQENMEENIRLTLRGESLDGLKWPRLLISDDDEKAEEKVSDGTVQPQSEQTGNAEKVSTPDVMPEETVATETHENYEMEAENAGGFENDSTTSTPSLTEITDDTNCICDDERMLKHQRNALSLDDVTILRSDSLTSPVIEDQTDVDNWSIVKKSYSWEAGFGGMLLRSCHPCLNALFCNLYVRDSDRKARQTEAGVARAFSLGHSAISRPWNLRRKARSVPDSRPVMPRVTTYEQDRYRPQRRLRDNNMPSSAVHALGASRDGSDQLTVQDKSNRLVPNLSHYAGLRSRWLVRGHVLTQGHCRSRIDRAIQRRQSRFDWAMQHRQWALHNNRSDTWYGGSQFFLRLRDGRRLSDRTSLGAVYRLTRSRSVHQYTSM